MVYKDPDKQREYTRKWMAEKRAQKKAEAEGKNTFKYPIFPLIHGIDDPANLNIYEVYARTKKQEAEVQK